MKLLLAKTWLLLPVGAALYLGTTAALLWPARFEHPVRARVALTPSNDPSWRFRNPEFEQLVSELNNERQALLDREKELQDLQARLVAERQEIYAATQAISRLQQEFDRTVVHFKNQQRENVKLQLKVIAGMTPLGAAMTLGQLPEEEAARILFALKPDQSSEILDALSKVSAEGAKLAARVTYRLKDVLPEPTEKRNGSS
jgi:flagellar motility protein MotE (MotC chaperone)